MRRIAKKVLLPLLCVVALTISAVGVIGFAGSAADTPTKSQAILDKYDIDSWNGTIQTGKAGDGIVTAWDVLKVDGYIEGVWLPWLTHSWLGSSLASNPDMENNDSWTLADGTVKDYWQTMTQIGIDNYNNTQLEQEIFDTYHWSPEVFRRKLHIIRSLLFGTMFMLDTGELEYNDETMANFRHAIDREFDLP